MGVAEALPGLRVPAGVTVAFSAAVTCMQAAVCSHVCPGLSFGCSMGLSVLTVHAAAVGRAV
jgi:hypothetical protein